MTQDDTSSASGGGALGGAETKGSEERNTHDDGTRGGDEEEDNRIGKDVERGEVDAAVAADVAPNDNDNDDDDDVDDAANQTVVNDTAESEADEHSDESRSISEEGTATSSPEDTAIGRPEDAKNGQQDPMPTMQDQDDDDLESGVGSSHIGTLCDEITLSSKDTTATYASCDDGVPPAANAATASAIPPEADGGTTPPTTMNADVENQKDDDALHENDGEASNTNTSNGNKERAMDSSKDHDAIDVEEGRPINDIEHAVDVSTQSYERGSSDEDDNNEDSNIEDNNNNSFVRNNDDNDDHNSTQSSYYSCASGMANTMADTMANFSSSTMREKQGHYYHHTQTNEKKNTKPLNETMETSGSEEDDDFRTTVDVSSPGPAHGGGGGGGGRRGPKKGSRGGAATTSFWCAPTSSSSSSNNNFRRNVIAAAVVSVGLIVLVGVGMGISIRNNKGNNDESAIAAANEKAIDLGASEYPSRDSRDDAAAADPFVEELLLSESPTMVPSKLSSSSPSSMPLTPTSTPSYSNDPTSHPSLTPTVPPSHYPSMAPTGAPSAYPTGTPTASPSVSVLPTLYPTVSPTNPPTKLFVPGDLAVTDTELDIRMSSGLSVKLIAETGKRPRYKDGGRSDRSFHEMMDGAGIISLEDGGYVYVSNSEIDSGEGGVYGLYFDKDGNVVEYKTLLDNTNRNCGGGLSPWNTWISCEEKGGGQCWQVDPNPNSEYHDTPRETLLGGDGGRYETVACDNRRPDRPIFFITEDHEFGAMRRFVAEGNGWESLHKGGSTTFLRILDGSRYEWTTNESLARASAAEYYRNSEGVVYHDGMLYFVAKKTKILFILDLETMTYESENTGAKFEGRGSFNAQPDQIILTNNYKRWIYFTEDGGDTPGVYVRNKDGTYHTIFEGITGSIYDGDETVGIALSPGRRKLYAGFQDAGVLMEFTRDDGMPFE